MGDQEEGAHAQAAGEVSSQPPADRSAAAAKNADKVVILAKNVANAPILKTTQFSASASHPFSKVIQHIQVSSCVRPDCMFACTCPHTFPWLRLAPPILRLCCTVHCFQSQRAPPPPCRTCCVCVCSLSTHLASFLNYSSAPFPRLRTYACTSAEQDTHVSSAQRCCCAPLHQPVLLPVARRTGL